MGPLLIPSSRKASSLCISCPQVGLDLSWHLPMTGCELGWRVESKPVAMHLRGSACCRILLRNCAGVQTSILPPDACLQSARRLLWCISPSCFLPSSAHGMQVAPLFQRRHAQSLAPLLAEGLLQTSPSSLGGHLSPSAPSPSLSSLGGHLSPSAPSPAPSSLGGHPSLGGSAWLTGMLSSSSRRLQSHWCFEATRCPEWTTQGEPSSLDACHQASSQNTKMSSTTAQRKPPGNGSHEPWRIWGILPARIQWIIGGVKYYQMKYYDALICSFV